MTHADSLKPRDHADKDVEAKIALIEREVEAWARKRDLWHDSGFFEYLTHTGRAPSSLPVLSRLCSDGNLIRILQGDGPAAIEAEFSELLSRQNCWYEFEDHGTLNIYPVEDCDYTNFSSYFHWQWVCSLIKEDIGDVYNELYAHFAKHPDDLYKLHWRDYEVLLAEIFKTQGFDVKIGPGQNDGGIDISLLQSDPIGDMLTVVQVKKYAPSNKIDLTAVQALYGAQVADGAQKAIFVTTSTYAPVAERFAARQNVQMKLATSSHVAEWSQTANLGIIEDKSLLTSKESVSKILRDIGRNNDSRIVRASSCYNMILNKFALVIKESKHAALLMALSGEVLSDDGYGQKGLEIPNLDPLLPKFNKDGVVRAQRKQQGDDVTYWDGYNLYSPWDGLPCYFDSM